MIRERPCTPFLPYKLRLYTGSRYNHRFLFRGTYFKFLVGHRYYVYTTSLEGSSLLHVISSLIQRTMGRPQRGNLKTEP